MDGGELVGEIQGDDAHGYFYVHWAWVKDGYPMLYTRLIKQVKCRTISLGLPEVYIHVNPDNEKLAKALRRVGFVPQAIVMKAVN